MVSVLAATGHNEELKTHLRGALNLGWTVDELRTTDETFYPRALTDLVEAVLDGTIREPIRLPTADE